MPYPDQIDPSRIDIGAQLKPGINQIVVRVATLLGNARGQSLTQGLVGPVRVVPYGQAAVYASTSARGRRRRHGAGDAGADARRAGLVRRVHAGRGEGLHGATTANVISTAGDAALSVSRPGHLTNGAFSLPQPLQVSLSKSTWTAPVSNDVGDDRVPPAHRRHRRAAHRDATRKTLTFTLSTTTP